MSSPQNNARARALRNWVRSKGPTVLCVLAALGVLGCGIWFDPDNHPATPSAVPAPLPTGVRTALPAPVGTDTPEPRRPPTATPYPYVTVPATVISPVETIVP